MRVVLLLVGLGLTGCLGSDAPELVVPFELSRRTPALLSSDDGVYALGERASAGEDWRLIPGSTVSVPRGTRLGFTAVGERVEAVVGAGSFPLRGVDSSSTQVGWFRVYDMPQEQPSSDGIGFEWNVDGQPDVFPDDNDGERREGVGLPDRD
ncbi:MAG: hypothetical protein AAF656_08715 [Planctomycetota bacterium]